MKKNEIVLYTAITGSYDKLNEIPKEFYFPDKIDYICLTDNSNITSKTYQIIKINLIKNDLKLTQRYYKIMINDYIKSYKKSIYIDGNMILKQNIFDLIDKLVSCDIICFKHYKRNCLYQESAALLHPYKQIGVKQNIVPLIQYIKKQNYPKMFGLTATGVLIRNHTKDIIKTMTDWFYFIQNYCRRDQLSFMYCIWKNNINILLLEQKNLYYYVTICKHKKKYNRTRLANINTEWKNQKGDRLEGYDPYENRKYYFNKINRLCKWNLDDDYCEEHYKFLELGIQAIHI